MMLFLYILLGIYTLAMVWLVAGVSKLKAFSEGPNGKNTSFSIIIPFRNEAANLPELLASLKALDYPKNQFEILLVNDGSTDTSVSIIEEALKETHLQYAVLENKRYSSSPKKDAITEALKKVQHPWIITTDADCKVPKDWLTVIDKFRSAKNPKMICGPVIFENQLNLVEQYQFWDGLSLQWATMGGFGWKKPLLCNGANLAFEKDCFFEVNGYEGNNHLATGDDLFLMEKVYALYPKKVLYLKNNQAIVYSKPVQSFSEIVSQRTRWASKTTQLKSPLTKALALGIFLGNFMVIAAFLCIFIYPMQLPHFGLLILLKYGLDFFSLLFTAQVFQKKYALGGLLFSVFIYPFLHCWIFIHCWKGSYTWKGRNFKK